MVTEGGPGTCLWRDGSGPRGAVDRAEVDDVPLAAPGDQREDPEGALLPWDRAIAHPRPIDPPVGPLVVLLPGCDPRGGTIRHVDPEQCCAGPYPQVQRANVEVIKDDQPVAVVSGGVADRLDLEVCAERQEATTSRRITREDGGPQGTHALGELRIRPAGAGRGLRKGPRVGRSSREVARTRRRMR